MRGITTATLTACTRRLPTLALGASTAVALVVIAAPPASAAHGADHADSPTVLAAALADAVTMVADAAQPDVVVVDPSRWQTVANIAAASLRNAEANGSLADVFEAQHLLAGCLSGFAAAGSAGSDVLGACADELAAVDGGIAPRLFAALELGDVSESAGPGIFDHTTEPAEAAASPESEPAEATAPNPDEDKDGATAGTGSGTGDAGGATDPQSEDPDHSAGTPAPSPEADTGDDDTAAVDGTHTHDGTDTADTDTADDVTGEKEAGEQESEDAATAAPQQPRTWNRPGTKEFVAPSAGTVTATMGDGRGHEGIDIANTLGAPIVAVADGEVIDAGPAQGFGLWVRIRHDDGSITTYGHNNDNLVEVGERVKAGQQIATVGNRGNSTGPHLHFEIEDPDGEIVDPVKWLAKRGASIVGLD
ncbi:peptidoglycan DD-metalloendopeptidase family protein (plasmid) [Rhodococcus opacus]|uniref:peptidoglycan DD-metalloendopeptidase family protein n=1 Tax=Rhodococcus TaxID=1827 RepID=UPI0010638A59|nr:peptidoglycan DD-metalloendopeptidase family protein [Rhodococcus sp. A14]RYF60754.1 MAG: M23 family peptidase [Comamonadaceae bacterium]